MDPYQISKLLHLLGVMIVFSSFGAALGGSETKKLSGMLHGIGLVLVIIAGFGLHGSLAKAQVISGMPLFVILKLVIWLIIGAMPAFRNRGILTAKASLFIALALGITAAWLGLAKPFM